MATSIFRINPNPSASYEGEDGSFDLDPSSLDDFIPIIYPDNLLGEKTFDDQDKITPFVGFYVLIPKNAKAIAERDVVDDTSTSRLIRLRGLDYANEVNREFIVGRNLTDIVNSTASVLSDIANDNIRIRIYRKINLLRKFICLYMPETLTSDMNASYTNLSVGQVFQSASLVNAVKIGINEYKKGGLEAGISSIAGSEQLVNFMASMSEAGGILGGLGTAAKFVQAGQGFAVNPLTEVFFENMQFRQFNMDYKFTPKSAHEAETVKKIIKTFRMYMVPEMISRDNFLGVFMSVPAFFQIKYYIQEKGIVRENENIPKISGCVLTGVNTDWAPDGQAMHRDGMPVTVRVQLNFTELELMHRDRIKEGY